jgi:hypothetical protein
VEEPEPMVPLIPIFSLRIGTGDSLVLKYLKNRNQRFFKNSKNRQQWSLPYTEGPKKPAVGLAFPSSISIGVLFTMTSGASEGPLFELWMWDFFTFFGGQIFPVEKFFSNW